MPNIIIHGLKSVLLLTRGFSVMEVDYTHADVIQVDYTRGLVDVDYTRSPVQVDYQRQTVQADYGRGTVDVDYGRDTIQTY